MRVRMLVQMSGTRDGENWPAPGQVFDVPDDEAESLIWLGNAASDSEPEKAVPADNSEKAVPEGEPETAVPEEKTETRKASAATIRAWAKTEGLDVPDRGQIPADIVELYEARD